MSAQMPPSPFACLVSVASKEYVASQDPPPTLASATTRISPPQIDRTIPARLVPIDPNTPYSRNNAAMMGGRRHITIPSARMFAPVPRPLAPSIEFTNEGVASLLEVMSLPIEHLLGHKYLLGTEFGESWSAHIAATNAAGSATCAELGEACKDPALAAEFGEHINEYLRALVDDKTASGEDVKFAIQHADRASGFGLIRFRARDLDTAENTAPLSERASAMRVCAHISIAWTRHQISLIGRISGPRDRLQQIYFRNCARYVAVVVLQSARMAILCHGADLTSEHMANIATETSKMLLMCIHLVGLTRDRVQVVSR